jgi:hypothetical protein
MMKKKKIKQEERLMPPNLLIMGQVVGELSLLGEKEAVQQLPNWSSYKVYRLNKHLS